MKKVEYALYDTKDNERLVVIGNEKEISNFLEGKVKSIRSYLTRKSLVLNRYKIEKLKGE